MLMDIADGSRMIYGRDSGSAAGTGGSSKVDVAPGGRDKDDGDDDGGRLCHIYAQIRESSTPSNVVVCRGDERQPQTLVYTSDSHAVRVQLAADSDAYFLVKFEGNNN